MIGDLVSNELFCFTFNANVAKRVKVELGGYIKYGGKSLNKRDTLYTGKQIVIF